MLFLLYMICSFFFFYPPGDSGKKSLSSIHFVVFAFSGEASKDRIKYVLLQQCGAQARALRTQDAGEIDTPHTEKAQTMNGRLRPRFEHTIFAAVWHDHLGFGRVFHFKCVTSSTDRFLHWVDNDQWQRLIYLCYFQQLARLL